MDVVGHASLLSMGYEFDIGKSALAETNNNLDDALTLIQEQPEKLLQIASKVDDGLVAQVKKTCFGDELIFYFFRLLHLDLNKIWPLPRYGSIVVTWNWLLKNYRLVMVSFILRNNFPAQVCFIFLFMFIFTNNNFLIFGAKFKY